MLISYIFNWYGTNSLCIPEILFQIDFCLISNKNGSSISSNYEEVHNNRTYMQTPE